MFDHKSEGGWSIIFLDIDGVLNSRRFLNWVEKHHPRKNYEFRRLDQRAIGYLNEIVSATGAHVVVSSVWRLNRKPAELQRMLRKHGFRGRVIGTTPNLPGCTTWKGRHAHRGAEIEQWLSETTLRVRRFVIIDDDNDMGPIDAHLVQTRWRYGLCRKHIKEAVRILTASHPTQRVCRMCLLRSGRSR